MWCPDLLFLPVYLRALVLLFQFSLESCFWNVSPDKCFICIFVCIVKWYWITWVLYKTNWKMQSRSTPTLFVCVWFVTPDYSKKWAGLFLKKNLRCRCQVLSTNCFTLQICFCCSVNDTLIASEGFFSKVQTVTMLCHNCYSLWLFFTACFQLKIAWCKAWA